MWLEGEGEAAGEPSAGFAKISKSKAYQPEFSSLRSLRLCDLCGVCERGSAREPLAPARGRATSSWY
jgi:hypothetical protein